MVLAVLQVQRRRGTLSVSLSRQAENPILILDHLSGQGCPETIPRIRRRARHGWIGIHIPDLCPSITVHLESLCDNCRTCEPSTSSGGKLLWLIRLYS